MGRQSMDPVTSIATLFELLINLLKIKDKRRRDVFSEILEPIFHRLEEVNVFYRQLFSTSIKAISVTAPGDSSNVVDTRGQPIIQQPDIPGRLDQIKRELIEGREKGS